MNDLGEEDGNHLKGHFQCTVSFFTEFPISFVLYSEFNGKIYMLDVIYYEGGIKMIKMVVLMLFVVLINIGCSNDTNTGIDSGNENDTEESTIDESPEVMVVSLIEVGNLTEALSLIHKYDLINVENPQKNYYEYLRYEEFLNQYNEGAFSSFLRSF